MKTTGEHGKLYPAKPIHGNKPKENSNHWHFVKCQNHFSKYEFVAYESFMFQTIA